MPKSRLPIWRKRGRRGAAALIALLAAAPLLTGCGTGLRLPDDGRRTVVTTFTVLADMTRAVSGGVLPVESIIKPGAEVHGYEPTPSDMLSAARADVVLDNGLGLESWFQQFVQRSEARHVTLSRGVEPIPIRAAGQQGAPNPHAWMSPRNAKIYVANIRDALTRIEPAHAETFRRNAADYTRRIDEIEQYLRTELGKLPEQQRALVSCEGAFSYLARDVGLREDYLWPVNSDSEGTPQQVKNTTRLVREQRVPAVFCESTVNDKAQQQVAAETGARMGGTLYVDSLSEPGGPVPTYLDLLRHDAETIVGGLSGGAR